jgi:hypothetical protein
VSNLNKKIYAKIEAWRNRRIEGEHPYLYRKRFNDHTGRPDRLNEWSRSSREARSGLVGPGPRQ